MVIGDWIHQLIYAKGLSEYLDEGIYVFPLRQVIDTMTYFGLSVVELLA